MLRRFEHVVRSALVTLVALVALVAVPGLRAQPAPCTTLPVPEAREPVAVLLGIRLPSPVPGSMESRRHSERMQRESRHHEALLAVLRRIRTDLGTPRAPDAPAAATRFVTIDSAGTLLVPDVASAATVLIGSTGEVVGIETATRSVHPAVDSALLAGVRAASGSSELAVLASSLGAERLRVTLFTTLVRAGARPPQGALVAYHDVVLPAYRGTPATLAPGAKGAPYPESARQAGIQGDVLSSFTISAAGAMEPGSLLAIRSAAPELERAVAAWLPTLAYRPATIGGCAVRVRVQQPTRFTLHR